MRKKHHKSLRPTGDASARYERGSHSGATWFDLMPAPADATDGGTPGFWPNFDGASWCTVGNPAKLDFANAFSVCSWAYQNPAPPQQGGEYMIGKDNPNLGRNVGLSSSDQNAQISAFIFDPAFLAAQWIATPGVQHYSVLVNLGAGSDLLLYVDGALRATKALGGRALAWAALTPWEMGRRQDGNDNLTGESDTARFYSRALSADEISRDYNAGKAAHL